MQPLDNNGKHHSHDHYANEEQEIYNCNMYHQHKSIKCIV